MLDRVVSYHNQLTIKWRRGFRWESGRRTANTCEAKATEMNTNAVAHFMSRGLTKIQKRDKKNFWGIAVISSKGWWLVIYENATSLQEGFIL